MNLSFSPAEQAFREEVRAFVREKLPSETREKVLKGREVTADEMMGWQRTLAEHGWGAPTWPKEHGGTGWDAVQEFIFDEETAAFGAPRLLPFGLRMVGPVIMQFGSEEQKKRFLPRIASATDFWCQGYSEPGSGSDLASLKTRAERKGDHYVVNGQKTWITLAQYADWIFCLVRTDPTAQKQQGISFLLIDMKTPGINVRPIITMDGGHEVNEVWFEDVRVPVENRVGEENKGWTYAKFLLGHERTNIAGVGASKRELQRLKHIAQHQMKRGRPLSEDPAFAARIAQVEIDLMALEVTNLRVLAEESARKAPGPVSSLLKIKGTEIQQALSELMMLAMGPLGLFFEREERPDLPAAAEGALSPTYCNFRKTSIYGGSNEIQKNILAQQLLKL